MLTGALQVSHFLKSIFIKFSVKSYDFNLKFTYHHNDIIINYSHCSITASLLEEVTDASGTTMFK